MIIRIRSAKRLKGLDGQTTFPAPGRAVITIDRSSNKTLAAYGATVLHELLHVWMHILQTKGFDPEHDFIDSTEKDALRHFQRVYGKGDK